MYVVQPLFYTSIGFDVPSFLHSQLTSEYRELSKEAKMLAKKLESLQQEQKKRIWARLVGRVWLSFPLFIIFDSTPQKLSRGSQGKDDKVLSLTAEMADKTRSSRIEKVSIRYVAAYAHWPSPVNASVG